MVEKISNSTGGNQCREDKEMIVIPILVVGVSVWSLNLAQDLALRAAGHSRVAETLSLLNNSQPCWQQKAVAASEGA